MNLTPREKQVCELIVRGLCNKEIGQALCISSRTVEDHRAKIYDKYDVRNAVELTRAVYGIMEPA